MLNALLPRQADNSYHGHKLALWLFGALVLMKTIIGFNSIISGDVVASSADGIPLNTFPAAAAATVVSLFALSGLRQLTFCLIGLVVLVRYRTLVPLMFALLLLEHVGRQVILQVLPISRTDRPPGAVVTIVLMAVTVVGMGLSLWRRRTR
jgi:ammonia channel protein AmtB